MLGLGNPVGQPGNDGIDDLVLDGKYIAELAIEGFAPESGAASGVDKPRRHAHPVAGPANAAFNNMGDPEVAAQLPYIAGVPLCDER